MRNFEDSVCGLRCDRNLARLVRQTAWCGGTGNGKKENWEIYNWGRMGKGVEWERVRERGRKRKTRRG